MFRLCMVAKKGESIMIVPVNQSNVYDAAVVHSISWQASHRAFCSPEFTAMHSPEHQASYLLKKMNNGSSVFMLLDPMPIGIVSLTESLIEDLYVLPDDQGKGYGTALLQYAIAHCRDLPTLWILENNASARAFYLKTGFRATGRRNMITHGLDEIEFALPVRYRTASAADIELLVQSRLDTLRAVNHLDAAYSFGAEFTAAVRRFFLDGDHETVLAMDGDRVVGCATLCFMELMPTFSHPTGLRAHLMNVHTDSSRRREGIAYQMVSMLIDSAWKRGVTEISLDATESGRPLYQKLGFAASQEGMTLEKQQWDAWASILK